MPKQLTKTLGDFNVSTDILRQGFVSLAGNKPELNDLGIIFEVGLTDLSLFPNIKLSNSAKRKEKQEWGSSFKPLIPALCLFLRHLYYCQKFPILFQRSGVGRAHKRQ